MGKRERTGAGPLVAKATFFWGLSWGVEGTIAEFGLLGSKSSLVGGSGGVGKAGVGRGRGGRLSVELGGNRTRGVEGGVDRGGGCRDRVGRETAVMGRGADDRRSKAGRVDSSSGQGGLQSRGSKKRV